MLTSLRHRVATWSATWLVCVVCSALAPSGAQAEIPSTQAESLIHGGLGLLFGKTVEPASLGAEISEPVFGIPENHRQLDLPSIPPGAKQPWRRLINPQLPRPFRERASRAHVFLDTEERLIRVAVVIEYEGCGAEFNWLKQTLAKKYAVKGDIAVASSGAAEQVFRLESKDRQIDVSCGPELTMDYGDYAALKQWTAAQARRTALYQREQSAIEKRRIVMERRRAMRFADTFTLGDRYRLMGGFGIAFNQPFAKNSTQVFPVDTPFVAVLPTLPADFEGGEIILEISPTKEPIVIRGRFDSVSFREVAKSLAAKYGTPLKSSSRHVIHKVGTNHAIVKQLTADQVEVAFIDTTAQAQQRQRLWEQESEGL